MVLVSGCGTLELLKGHPCCHQSGRWHPWLLLIAVPSAGLTGGCGQSLAASPRTPPPGHLPRTPPAQPGTATPTRAPVGPQHRGEPDPQCWEWEMLPKPCALGHTSAMTSLSSPVSQPRTISSTLTAPRHPQPPCKGLHREGLLLHLLPTLITDAQQQHQPLLAVLPAQTPWCALAMGTAKDGAST